MVVVMWVVIVLLGWSSVNGAKDSTTTMLHVFDTIANVMEGDDKFDR